MVLYHKKYRFAVAFEPDQQEYIEKLSREENISMAEAVRRLVDGGRAIHKAVRDEGPNPAYHHKIMERHRKEWPTLWEAIDLLLKH